MRQVSVAMLVILALSADAAVAQTVAAGRDVCGIAWFQEETSRQEFSRLSNTLENTERHKDANRTGAEASTILLKRLTSIRTVDLLGPRIVAERAARQSSRAPELAAVQAQLATYCLERMRRSPDSFTSAVSTQAARLRQLAGLPDDQLIAAFSGDTVQIMQDFGTPEAAARTLRVILAGVR